MKNKILTFLIDYGHGATVSQIRAVGRVSGTRNTVSRCVSRLVAAKKLVVNLVGRTPYYSIAPVEQTSTSETSASVVANS